MIYEGIIIAGSSKLGEELDSKRSESCAVSEWDLASIHEGSIHGTNVGNDEYNSFDVSKCSSLGIKERHVIGLKGNIEDSDKLWNTVYFIDFISDFISVDNSDVNTEAFSVVTFDDAKLGKFYSKMLGVSDTSKLGGECACKETASLGVPEWSDEDIPEGGILCTDLGNDE